MKPDDWTRLLISPILSWIIAALTLFVVWVIGEMNTYSFLAVLLVPPIILIIFLWYAKRRLSEPDTDLEFSSYFEPRGHTVKLKDKFQLVWIFKNNLNKEIKILSYNIRINLNGEVFRNHNWRPNYTPTIPPRDTVTNFWTERGKGSYGIENPGVYEFQNIVEYQLPNNDKKMAYHSCQLVIVQQFPLWI